MRKKNGTIATQQYSLNLPVGIPQRTPWLYKENYKKEKGDTQIFMVKR